MHIYTHTYIYRYIYIYVCIHAIGVHIILHLYTCFFVIYFLSAHVYTTRTCQYDTHVYLSLYIHIYILFFYFRMDTSPSCIIAEKFWRKHVNLQHNCNCHVDLQLIFQSPRAALRAASSLAESYVTLSFSFNLESKGFATCGLESTWIWSTIYNEIECDNWDSTNQNQAYTQTISTQET